MPPVVVGAIAAGAGAVAAAGSIGAVTFFGLTGFSALLAQAAVGAVFSGLSGALSPKQKSLSGRTGSLSYDAASRTQQFRQPVTVRPIIVGEVRISGGVVYATSTQSNKYLHVIIPLGAHQFKSIDEVWLDDDVVPNDWLDGNGMVTTGKYAGKVRIRKHLGEDGQTADAVLVSEVAEWTSAHRGRGVPYIYIRYELDRKLFPNGAPNASVVCRGKEIYDSRSGIEAWSPNLALIANYYLTDPNHGAEIDGDNISAAETEAAANACEEIVDAKTIDMVVSSVAAATDIITLTGSILQFQRGDQVEIIAPGGAPGGTATATNYYVIPYQFKGTPRIKLAASLDDAVNDVAVDLSSSGSGTITIRKTGEPRYFGGGVLPTDATLGSNLRDILSGMAGKTVEAGGYWKVFAGVYRAPSVTLDESHLTGSMIVKTRVSRDEKFNTVKGIYVSPLNNWQPSDYPVVTNSTHVTADMGVSLPTELDLPLTQRASTAQRIATIYLNDHRQEIGVNHPTNLHGMQFEPCSTLNLNNDRMGWAGKAFEVLTWKFTVNEASAGEVPVIGIDMVLKETAAGVYSWDSEAELLVDPAPNTNLPDAFTVSAPVGLAVDSIRISTLDSDSTFRVVLSWTLHENAFVREGGQIQIEYRKTGDTDWLSVTPARGDSIRADVFTGELGTQYDIRARAVNNKGIPSDWNEALSGFTVGTSGGVTSTEDWGDWVTDPPDTTEDWGDWVTDPPDTTDDWGGFTA